VQVRRAHIEYAGPVQPAGRSLKNYLFPLMLVFIGVELSLPIAAQYFLAGCLLMVMGLPHGAFDIALAHEARREQGFPPIPTTAMVTLYLAIAGAMAAVWLITPTGALALFFILAIDHFSEELRPALDPWIARATATAMLTAPILLHPAELKSLFDLIKGSNTGLDFADVSILIAPSAITIAVAAVAMLVHDAQYRDAAKIIASILMMIVLPPIIAFTAYFCFEHAPRYLLQVKRHLGGELNDHVMRQAAGFTLASLIGAAVLAIAFHQGMFSEATIKAAFIALSILTLPHMTMPLAVARMTRRRRAMPVLS